MTSRVPIDDISIVSVSESIVSTGGILLTGTGPMQKPTVILTLHEVELRVFLAGFVFEGGHAGFGIQMDQRPG